MIDTPPTGPDAPFVGQLPGETPHDAISRLERLPAPIYKHIAATDAWQALAAAAAAQAAQARRAAGPREYPALNHISETDLFHGYGVRRSR